MAIAYHLSGLFHWLRLVRKYKRPDAVFYFTGGIGDQLLCTAVARELQKRKPQRIWLLSHVPELLENNPDIAAVPPIDLALIPWCRLSRARVQRLFYQEYDANNGRDMPLREPAIAALCRRAGVTGDVLLRPYLPPFNQTTSPDRQRPKIAIHSSCLSARYPIANKQWPVDNFSRVATELNRFANVIQLGAKDDPLLPGVIDKRGIRLLDATEELAQCNLFVGLVGFLMHLARAVERPAVIVYGGREPPELTGYSCNSNLASRPPCSPCWHYSKCDYLRTCLTNITPEQVIGAVEEKLKTPQPRPLRTDSYYIQPVPSCA